MKFAFIPLSMISASALLAEMNGLPMPDVSNVTATAILGWYAWHTASRTIPGVVADFRGELAARQAEARADREVFRQEICAERAQRQADNAALSRALHELSDQIAQSSRKPRRNTSSDEQLRKRAARQTEGEPSSL